MNLESYTVRRDQRWRRSQELWARRCERGAGPDPKTRHSQPHRILALPRGLQRRPLPRSRTSTSPRQRRRRDRSGNTSPGTTRAGPTRSRGLLSRPSPRATVSPRRRRRRRTRARTEREKCRRRRPRRQPGGAGGGGEKLSKAGSPLTKGPGATFYKLKARQATPRLLGVGGGPGRNQMAEGEGIRQVELVRISRAGTRVQNKWNRTKGKFYASEFLHRLGKIISIYSLWNIYVIRIL